MSDTSQGPNWWRASDGKWYPPETHPDYVSGDQPPTAVPPTQVQPTVGPGPGPGGPATFPPAGAPAYGGPPPGGAPFGGPPPGGPPLGGPPPGGPPLPVGSSGGGSKRGLLIALVALVVLGLIGAGAYLVTKDDGDNSKVAASDNSETTVKSKASKTDATEATDATDGSDATDSSNTAAPGSVDVQVVSSGGSQFLDADGKPVGSWAAILENKGSAPAQLVQVDVEFKDAAGTVLGTDLAFVDLLPPGGKSAVRGDMLNVPAGVTTLSLTVDPSTIPPGKKIKPGAITVEGVKSTPDPTGLVITGTVKSTFAVELKSVSVVGVLFDASGKIIGGAFTFVDKLPSKGSAPLDMKDFDKVPGVDHVEVFVKLPTDLLT